MPDISNIDYRATVFSEWQRTDDARLAYLGFVAGNISNPPTVTNFTPGPIVSGASVSFDVMDDGSLRRVVVIARIASLGLEEFVTDGDRFAARYEGTVADISGGKRYTVKRRGGWPDGSLTFDVYALDTTGQEA